MKSLTITEKNIVRVDFDEDIEQLLCSINTIKHIDIKKLVILKINFNKIRKLKTKTNEVSLKLLEIVGNRVKDIRYINTSILTVRNKIKDLSYLGRSSYTNNIYLGRLGHYL